MSQEYTDQDQTTQQHYEEPNQEETQNQETGYNNDQEVAHAQTAQKPENDKEKNFRQLREVAEQLKKERDELYQVVQQQKQKTNQTKEEAEEELRLNPDDLVEGKHYAALQKKINNLESQVKNYEKQSAEMTVETRLKNQYPDFDRVVNSKTVEALRNQYPELASTIYSSNDLYSKAVSAYTLIKKLDLAPDAQAEYEQNLAEKNKEKPRSLAAVKQNDSPLTRAHAFENGLTDDLRKELWREMVKARESS